MTFNFPFPEDVDIHKKYTYKAEAVKRGEGVWDGTLVTVQRNNPDGSVDDVYQYNRNYSMMKTFEPFRQLQGDTWHEYALISPRYTGFEVLDLEKGEVVAKRPDPVMTQERYDTSPTTYDKYGWTPGTEISSWGFCPVEFHVEDFNEQFSRSERSLEYYEKYADEYVEKMHKVSGQFGLYSGCVWGDDNGWKIRYIDLSRISEGIVTEDERFGYVTLGGDLKDVDYWPDSNTVVLPVEVHFNLETGKASKWDLEFAKDLEDIDV